MNIEHFTEKAREAISDAAQVAREYNHNQIEVEHLLAALLTQEGGVVQQIIAKVSGNLAAAQRIVNDERHITLQLTDAARDLLAEMGYDPQFGARPLKRVIQQEIENRIARGILEGAIHDGDTVEIDAKDGKIVIEPVREQTQEEAHAL